jgi:serine/threonine protein phosphatase PrpC
MQVKVEIRGRSEDTPEGYAATACAQGSSHERYEDSFVLLTRDIPLVAEAGRGELFAVFDGVSKAPQGLRASNIMAGSLVDFYRARNFHPPTCEALRTLLFENNLKIHNCGADQWGACVGTVAWVKESVLHLFHVGDTNAVLITDDGPHMLTEARDWKSSHFGMGPNLEIAEYSIDLSQKGDYLLLCSDGLTGGAQDDFQSIAQFLGNNSIEVAARLMVSSAQLRSTDDITVVLVDIAELLC